MSSATTVTDAPSAPKPTPPPTMPPRAPNGNRPEGTGWLIECGTRGSQELRHVIVPLKAGTKAPSCLSIVPLPDSAPLVRVETCRFWDGGRNNAANNIFTVFGGKRYTLRHIITALHNPDTKASWRQCVILWRQ